MAVLGYSAPSDMVNSHSLNAARKICYQHGLQLVCALDGAAPNPNLYNPAHLVHYHQYQFLPYAFEHGVFSIVSSRYDEEIRQFCEQLYSYPIRFVIAPERDLNQWLSTQGATRHVRSAKLRLRRRFKHLCADRTLVKSQIFPLIAPFILLALALVIKPEESAAIIIAMACLFYSATLLFKLLIYKQWQLLQQEKPQSTPLLKDAALPIYTLLIPAYDEPPEVLENLLRAVEALNYPNNQKDVLFICEADDVATVQALKSLHPPEYCKIIEVPPSLPRTKPKALNVALAYAKGEYVVIYDAEDRPHPMQLRLAASRFAAEPNIACLQAPLNYYNRKENLLTQLFAIEYGTLFRMQLPALERLCLPIPLGGTSNHIRMEVLQEAAGWDAFNVTEDADLGLRLSYLGHKISVLDSITEEEAPISLRAWLKQRSRWIKGYMQTWLVYMRNPQELKNKIGNKAYYGFQFFIGAPALTFMLAPLFWLVFIAAYSNIISFSIPLWLNIACISCLLFGIYSHWLYAKACLILHDWRGMQLAASLFPFYWFLHIIASFMALHDLIKHPHQWRKTRHGVSHAQTK